MDGANVNVGQASSVAVYDWDGDKDLDLIIGMIAGPVSFVPNESAGAELRFGKPVALLAGGNEIAADDGGPCIADWDGDGQADLLLGDSDGKVQFYKASASSPIPVLASPEILVAADKTAFDMAPSRTRPASRTKLSVVDWNLDGKLDLLVGDFWMSPARKTLTSAEETKLRRLREAADREVQLRNRIGTDAEHAARERLKMPAGKKLTSEQQSRLALARRNEAARLRKERFSPDKLSALRGQIAALQPQAQYHGNVWLYLRM